MNYCLTCEKHVHEYDTPACTEIGHEHLQIFTLADYQKTLNNHKPFFWNPMVNELTPILAVFPTWEVHLEGYGLKLQLHPEHPVYLQRI